jgi:hypothetical protein
MSDNDVKKATDELKALAPDYAQLTQDVLFGDVWKRPPIAQRDKSLITVTCLAALNRIEQVEFHFLESHDFSGKTIVPFCTHEGSGMGHSEQDIAKACPKATVLKGIAIHGTSASSAASTVSSWIEELSIS